MSRREHGFTLIELMIVIAIIAIIAAIAIPNLLAARLSANETAAIATLRNIVSAQAQFQQSAKADSDDDGTGEYGGFQEMSGAVAGRMNSLLVPPVLSTGFRIVTANGEVTRSGYLFRMYLPAAAADGSAVGEAGAGGCFGTAAVPTCDPDLAETTWACYAWPVNYNQSGNRTFFTNQAGDVLAFEGSAAGTQYSGTTAAGTPPSPYAAFSVATDITSNVDVGGAGQTGDATATWRQVQ